MKKRHEIVMFEYESGHLDAKTQHLCMMVAHLASRNGYCAKGRRDAARKAGATEGEIREAIGLAIRGGASVVYQEAIDHGLAE